MFILSGLDMTSNAVFFELCTVASGMDILTGVIVLVYFILEQDIRVNLWPLDGQFVSWYILKLFKFYGRKSISGTGFSCISGGCLEWHTCLKERTYTSLYSVYVSRKKKWIFVREKTSCKNWFVLWLSLKLFKIFIYF